MNQSATLVDMAQALLPLLDLTRLEESTALDIKKLVEAADYYKVAALCIYPAHLQYLPRQLATPCATVVNFPSGQQPVARTLEELNRALAFPQVKEVDYVFPYSWYLVGQVEEALAACSQALQQCHQANILFKVILESGAFPNTESIYRVSVDLIKLGCDFLKTSTGKIPTGATLEAATAMLQAIANSGKPCGIKLSGGIRTLAQAAIYYQLATEMLGKIPDKNWFRIGASSLLNEIQELLRE